MSRYPTPRRFDAHAPLVVRHPFRLAGRRFEPGETFDRSRHAVSVRRTRQLFDMGKLEMVDGFNFDDAEPVTDEPVTLNEGRSDDLDGLSMAELRDIAEMEGAPSRRSKDEQRDAIREHRMELGLHD